MLAQMASLHEREGAGKNESISPSTLNILEFLDQIDPNCFQHTILYSSIFCVYCISLFATCKQIMRLHRRLQPFLSETGLCVFVLRTVSTPETARNMLIDIVDQLLPNLLPTHFQVPFRFLVSFRFWVFSKEPIQEESKWVPPAWSHLLARRSQCRRILHFDLLWFQHPAAFYLL